MGTTAAARWHLAWMAAGTGAALLLLVLGVLLDVSGSGHITLQPLWQDPVQSVLVWQVRLPRGLGAFAAGALLGLAGAIAQGLFRNPLADPFLLGSASGASLGVATLLAGTQAALTGQEASLTMAGFTGALAASGLALVLARGAAQGARLLLAGLVVGMVLGAATQLVLLAAPEALQAMQGFLLGSTSLLGWPETRMLAGTWAICLIAGIALAPALDTLALGETTALSLGLPVGLLRLALLAVLALATGSAVAHVGLVAFVGLAAPHLARTLARTRHAAHLLLASLAGGVLLEGADLLARAALAPRELPVGILTALAGGLYLLWSIAR